MKYEKPELAVAGLAAAAIKNPNPSPKLNANIMDGSGGGYHTSSAYAADE